MAYVASWIAPMGTRTGGLMSTGEPWNERGFNEWNNMQETNGYYKPPFCQWPCGGFTRKEAHMRCVKGEMCVAPGSDEFMSRYDTQGRPLRANVDLTTLVHRDAHKDRPATSSTCNLMTNLMAPIGYSVKGGPKIAPAIGAARFVRGNSMPNLPVSSKAGVPIGMLGEKESPRERLAASMAQKQSAAQAAESGQAAAALTDGQVELQPKRRLLPPARPQLPGGGPRRTTFRGHLRGGDSLRACAARRMEMTGGALGFPKPLTENGKLMGPGRVPKKDDPDSSPVRRFPLGARPLPSPAKYLGLLEPMGAMGPATPTIEERLATAQSEGRASASCPSTAQILEQQVLFFDPPENATPRTRTLECFQRPSNRPGAKGRA